MTKYILIIIFFAFFISINLYSQFDFKYMGNIEVIRDNKKINLDAYGKLYDKDIVKTGENGFVEIKINNKYYYIANNGIVDIVSKNAKLKNGALYIRNKSFSSLEEFEKYDKELKVYADPVPLYAGKVGNIYIISEEDIKIKDSKLLGSSSPIVKFFEVKNDKMKIYKSVFGIYVGSQDEKYRFVCDMELKDKTLLSLAIDIKSDFTPPPPKPKQITGVTSTMTNIISNPQKSKEERELLHGKIYASYTPTNYADKVYMIPAQGRYSSQFGAFRGYTKDYARYHQGFDIANTNGAPIFAANNGVVRVARELFVRGNCVVIDHGEGVYSSYFHMSKLIAKEGQYVKKGDIIGLIGSTGMSTGPHCHWEMRAGNMTFDPLSILEKTSSFDIKNLTRIK